jgi:hypothetical protein
MFPRVEYKSGFKTFVTNYSISLGEVLIMMIGAMGGFSLLMWPFSMGNVLQKILPAIKKYWWLRWPLLILCIIIARWVYKLKKKEKYLFGMILVIGGVAACIGAIMIIVHEEIKPETGFITALSIGGGIFLMADGFSYINEDEEEKRKKKIIKY